jgi:predicted AAA+ superfamily ATPase
VSTYIARLVDPVLAKRLTASGAVVIDGPKASGKTETGRRFAGSEVLLDSDLAQRQFALADPRFVLSGATPRLLDGWQSVPDLWNAVRREIDERKNVGQFILTGSASPADDLTRHSGAGRFSRLRMRPLTLVETGHAVRELSLSGLLDGEAASAPDQKTSLSDLTERMIAGGWPASQSRGLPESFRYAVDYLDQVARLDIAGLEDVRHDPRKVSALLRSIARTTASETSNATLARDSGGVEGALHADTVARYLDALERAFIVEIQEAWDVPLRSRTPLRKAPKRHLVDSSLTTAALRIGAPEMLLRDPNTLGLLFESLVFQQLRVFADIADAGVYHFRSKTGLEVDAIVERADGAWGAFEVKLGAGLLDAAAATLRTFAATIDTSRHRAPTLLAVIVPTGPSYVRRDGISVVALASLGA